MVEWFYSDVLEREADELLGSLSLIDPDIAFEPGFVPGFFFSDGAV